VLKVLAILGGSLFTVGACWSTGKLLLDRMRLRFHPMEEHFFRFTIGSSLFSLLIFCLTASYLARTWVFLIAGLIPILFAWRSKNTGTAPEPLPALARPWTLAFIIVLLVYGVFYLVNAMAPETSPDGSTYHLGLVARYLRQHGFGRITTDMYANLSEGVEMLFLPAFAIGKHSAAAMVEFAFLAALPLGMLSYARRVGYPVAGVVGAVATFTSPLFGISGTSAYNDVAGVCIVFAAYYLLQIWVESRDTRLIALTGLLAGFAFGIKYTLFLAVPYAGLVMAWKLWRVRRPILRPLFLFGACALLMMAPWMTKNWIVVSNPLSPFMNAVFPNPYVTIHFERDYVELMRNWQHLTPRQRIEEATWRGEKTEGFLSPFFLLAPLALFALRYAAGRQLLLAGGLFFLPGLTNIQARFLMPCVPFISIALGMAATQVPLAAWAFIAIPVVLGWPKVYPKYCGTYAWRVRDFPWKAALRKIPESKVLEDRLPDIAMSRLIEQCVPRNGRVLSFGTPPEAYTSRDVIIGYESAFGNFLVDLFQVPLNVDFQPTRVLTFTFPQRELKKVRVIQTAKADEDRWTVAELRLYLGEEEIARKPEWHLSAKPNRWDVALAFDNNPSTRWDSNQAIFPGMDLTIEFSSPETINRVVMECSHDQWKTRFKLQGAGVDGVWKDLAGEPESADRVTDWSLRRASVLAAKERGITHLLVFPTDYGADDFFTNRHEWGLELTGTAPNARLYRLK
jgi:Dolichyl-phosphate-mannose-protein mannosyltransferase